MRWIDCLLAGPYLKLMLKEFLEHIRALPDDDNADNDDNDD